MSGLSSALRQWRREQARIEGVEEYRVLPNATLEALVGALPRTKDELCAIKGIKEAKYRKYGKALLGMVKEYAESSLSDMVEESASLEADSFSFEGVKDGISDVSSEAVSDQPLPVSRFLDGLNIELSGMAARVQGEVSSVDVRERVVYFTLKDTEDESTLNCLIFRYQYEISGVALAIGDEVIVEGVPEIYKPSGRLSLKVGVIELFGEGALKKAYEELRKKLETEGLFAPERKKVLPKFPERIALITSEQGAAIGDFTMNLGQQGLKVDFYPVSVEGKKAVFEIIEALKYFNQRANDYDVLVLIRGGGSLESLQAFNNEALTREVAACEIPTLLGVGHEKDITLAALVADVMVSTPTAAARTLREPWEAARGLVEHFRYQLPTLFRERLSDTRHDLEWKSETLLSKLGIFIERARSLEQDITERLTLLRSLVREQLSNLDRNRSDLVQGFTGLLARVSERFSHTEERLHQYDPRAVLRLGYSLVRSGGKVMRSITQTAVGDILDIQLSDGRLETKVEKISK